LSYNDSDGSYAWTSTDKTMIECSNGNRYNATFAGLQAAVALGGHITLPAMNVTCTSKVNITSNSVITGQGYNRTVLFLGNAENDYIFEMASKNNVTIEGITFKCNNASQTTGRSGAINVTGTSNHIIIRDCMMFNSYYTPILLGHLSVNVHHILIENCYIDGVRRSIGTYPSGIRIYGYNNIIRGCTIKNTWATGITIESDDVGAPNTRTGHYNILDGNDISGVVSAGITMEGKGTTTPLRDKGSNTSVINNFIHDCNSTAYLATDGIYSSGIVIGDDTFCSHNIVTNIHGVGIGTHGNYSIISENTIQHVTGKSGDSGWGIFNEDEKARHIQIINNNINDTKTAIYVEAPNTLISGNTIDYASTNGIYLETGSMGTTVMENTIEKAVAAAIYCVRQTDGNYTISHNTIKTNAYANGAIFLKYTQNSTISENKFLACVKGIVEWAPCNNTIMWNNYVGCSSTPCTVAGDSCELLLNRTTGKIGRRIASGLSWI